jgi:hypothetical protein
MKAFCFLPIAISLPGSRAAWRIEARFDSSITHADWSIDDRSHLVSNPLASFPAAFYSSPACLCSFFSSSSLWRVWVLFRIRRFWFETPWMLSLSLLRLCLLRLRLMKFSNPKTRFHGSRGSVPILLAARMRPRMPPPTGIFLDIQPSNSLPFASPFSIWVFCEIELHICC